MASYDLSHPVVQHLMTAGSGWSMGPDFQDGLVLHGRILYGNELRILLEAPLEDIPLMLATTPEDWSYWYGIHIPDRTYYLEIIVHILQLRLSMETPT